MPQPFLDACALAELVRDGTASPAELVDDAVARIEKLNPELNAVIRTRFVEARREAAGDLPDGPLRGVPIVLKDLLCSMAGEEIHEGMQAVKKARYVADRDQELARRLRAAGMVVVGRTNTPELGILPTTEPAAYGPTRNPWDTARSTGGSSGGSAAAVASGMVPLGHANDGGGSIRIPASECGLVGLKPSRGRVPLGPEWGDVMGGLVCELAVTRTVRDTAAVLDAVAGPAPGDPYAAPPQERPYVDELRVAPGRLHIGMQSAAFGGTVVTHPDCVAAVEGAAAVLESLGHGVEPAHVAALDAPEFIEAFLLVWSAGTAFDVDHHWPDRLGRPLTEDDVEPLTWALADAGRSASAADFLDARHKLQRISRQVAEWYEGGFDLLLTPTIAEPPPLLGQFDSTVDNPLHGLLRAAEVVPFTPAFNVTGQPAISVPLHWNGQGLPIGVQLVARYGREDVLLRVAAQLEEAVPWAARRPPVGA
ncbi:MAG TPA: amidase family protein [Acidimicrobiales bacterium]|nr:amidase family protein [Acidimicrobiales bacterium]